MDLWNLQIPAPVALAVMAAMGYLVSRWSRPAANDMVVRSRRELKRAQAVAIGIGKDRLDGPPEPGQAPRQRVAVQGAGEPAERPAAGRRLERSLPRGRRHSQAHAATGHADRQRLRRNPPAKRQL